MVSRSRTIPPACRQDPETHTALPAAVGIVLLMLSIEFLGWGWTAAIWLGSIALLPVLMREER